jgi:hypothetical protein
MQKEGNSMAQSEIQATLENYLKSDDFKSGVISATRAAWAGSGYSVELGNKYKSSGIILGLPVFDDDEEYQEAIDDNEMNEEEYFDLVFTNNEEELREAIKRKLSL